MLAFILWSLLGLAMVILGIYDYCSKKEVAFGFWANAKIAPIKDVKSYNRALGKLFMVYGILLILLGLPLLIGNKSPLIVLTIVGTSLLSIVVMAIYTIKIEGKYRK